MDLAQKSAKLSDKSAAVSRDAPFPDLPDESPRDSFDRPQDRRIHPRFLVDSDSTLLLVSRGLSLPSRILDLSLDGCRLRTRERYALPARARVEVAFKVNGIAFRFLGVIQWTDSRHCAGIRFVDIIARRREQLAEVIGEIESVTVAKAAKAAAEREAQKDTQAAEESLPPETLHQGTTSAKLSSSQNSPQPGVLYQGTTSVVPQTLQYQRRALAPAQPSVRAMRRLGEDPAAKRAAELAAWEAEEWAEIQKLEQPKTEAPQPSESPSQAPPKRDRRVQSRHPVDTTAAILLINIGSTLTGRIVDLSGGGCRILCDERFPVGIYTRVETEFHLEGLPFRLGGVIQAIHDRRTVGIRFLDMSGRKREQIEQLIEEIEASAKPPAAEQ